MSRVRATSTILLFALATLPSEARADWIVTPYAGIAWNTRVTFIDVVGPFENRFELRPTYGAAVTWTKGGLFDFEGDVGLSPGLFSRRIPEVEGDDFEYGDNQLITIMGNVKVDLPWRIGGIRPYGVAGAGLFHTRVADPDDAFDVSGSQLGFDAGGGITASMGGRLRLQVDARYFRTLQPKHPTDELPLAIDTMSFWRTVAGIGFRF